MPKLVNPWGEQGFEWDRIVFGGVEFTGKVEVTGKPWKKKSDHRHARGRNGGRTVAAGWDLGEWSITLSAVTDAQIDQLSALIAAVTDRSPTTQDVNALSIAHPAIAIAGVSQVTLDDAAAPEVTDPGGLVVWVCKVKAYTPPVPKPVVRAPRPAPQSTGHSVYATAAGPELAGHSVYVNPAGPPLAPTPPADPSPNP